MSNVPNVKISGRHFVVALAGVLSLVVVMLIGFDITES